MKQRIQNAFNRAASTYGQVARVQKQIAEHAASLVPRKKYRNILEIGCGNGQSTQALQSRLGCESYCALDLAPNMLKQARLQCPRAFYLAADGENPPLRRHSFDLLFSTSCVQWYLNPEKSLSDNLALLVRGGHFSLSMFIKGTFYEIEECKRQTGYGSVLELRDQQEYIEIFEKKSKIHECVARDYTVFYNSFYDFAKQNKQSGAVTTSSPTYGNKRKKEDFIATYTRLYGREDKIQVTYKALFISGTA